MKYLNFGDSRDGPGWKRVCFNALLRIGGNWLMPEGMDFQINFTVERY